MELTISVMSENPFGQLEEAYRNSCELLSQGITIGHWVQVNHRPFGPIWSGTSPVDCIEDNKWSKIAIPKNIHQASICDIGILQGKATSQATFTLQLFGKSAETGLYVVIVCKATGFYTPVMSIQDLLWLCHEPIEVNVEVNTSLKLLLASLAYQDIRISPEVLMEENIQSWLAAAIEDARMMIAGLFQLGVEYFDSVQNGPGREVFLNFAKMGVSGAWETTSLGKFLKRFHLS